VRDAVPFAMAVFCWCDADGRVTHAYMDALMGETLRVTDGDLRPLERDLGLTFRDTLLFGDDVNNSRHAYAAGFEQTETFKTQLEPMGLRWQLDGVVRNAQRPFGLLVLAREAVRPDFSEQEHETLRDLLA
jgi:hypothetical protein